MFDLRGGYWKPDGEFMPSLIAELGEVIEKHLVTIDLMHKEELDEHQKKLIEEKAGRIRSTDKAAGCICEE